MINGYLITKSILRSYEKGKFSYFSFLIRRLIRLWPLVLLAAVVSLVVGYFNMLPDDLENLGESVVASNFFAYNILANITTGDYWNTVQEYKPLMHTWYLGIIVQFYVFHPLIVMAVHKLSKKKFNRYLVCVLGLVTAASLALYLLPGDTSPKFYYLQYRLFELMLGGLLAVCIERDWVKNGLQKAGKYLWISAPILAAIFILNVELIPSSAKLLIVVLLSCVAIMYITGEKVETVLPYRWMVRMGEASFSIFVWHQVILAFYRYIINSEPSWYEDILLLLIIAAVSVVSFMFVEKKINPRKLKGQIAVFAGCAVVCIISACGGLYLYSVAGVVRDVPELDIYTSDIHRGMHAEYNDRVYDMDVNFSDDNRIKVLVIGDSFGRDWANVLLESDVIDQLDITYIFTTNLSENDINRISSADYLFILASAAVNDTFPDYLYENISEGTKVYGIGTKRYGNTNGNLYSKRNRDDYLSQTVSYAAVADIYEEEKAYFGDNYIDFIAPILQEDGYVRAFTDDGKYISQDCRHLTQAGAQYYSRILNLEEIFDLE